MTTKENIIKITSMFDKLFFCLIVFFILSSTNCSSGKVNIERNIDKKYSKKELNTIIQGIRAKKIQLGIRVINASNSKVFYEFNSRTLFRPASNTKLLTAIGALLILKPEYQFKTAVYIKGSIINGEVEAILIRGGGDPGLSVKNLRDMANYLKIIGIKKAENIYFDDFRFDNIPFPDGWINNDLKYNYGSPVSALSLEKNICKIIISPDKSNGSSKIIYYPESKFISVINRVKIGKSTNIDYTSHYKNGRNYFKLSGTININSSPLLIKRPVNSPSIYTANIFYEILKSRGIKLLNMPVRKKVNLLFRQIYLHKSETVYKMLYDMLKQSDNSIAEHLIKEIGVVGKEKSGSVKNGVLSLKEILHKRYGFKEAFRQKDGSGISRYNLISPYQISNIFLSLYKDFRYREEFFSLLPLFSIEGTVKDRKLNRDFLRYIRVKTGTLKDSSAFSGICKSRTGKIFIFSIMFKDYLINSKKIKLLEDEIIKHIINQ